MPPEPDATRIAAQALAVRGWPVMPVRADGKDPLTKHGVKDATTDERTILHWFDKWPDANLGIATGAPGPTVLDVDDLDKGRTVLGELERTGAPEVATTRGRHLYFRGSEHGTISLDYGELRSRGSYVVCPPSVHPSGKQYVWLVEPGGPLFEVPEFVIGDKRPAGIGTLEVRAEKVAHGERHDHLKDIAIRLVRGGITDAATIARMLQAEYVENCVTYPPAKPGEFDKLAAWATTTRIAQRERNQRKHAEATGTTETPSYELPEHAPGDNASLAEHREWVRRHGGWRSGVDIASVERFGGRLVDPLHIHLSNGLVIDFESQGDISNTVKWTKTVIAGTNGIANPPTLGVQKDQWRVHQVYRSLCTLASPPPEQIEAEDYRTILDDMLPLCEPVGGHTLDTAATRFKLVEVLRLRPFWDPRARPPKDDPKAEMPQPALVVDAKTHAQYLRGGELRDYFIFRGAGLDMRRFPGRMSLIGLERVHVFGREEASSGVTGARRRTNRTLLYRLPGDE